MTVYVKLEDGVIADIGFRGVGMRHLHGLRLHDDGIDGGEDRTGGGRPFREFHDMVPGRSRRPDPGLGKLEAFAGVSEFPVRVKCATLAWHTLRTALKTPGGAVSTE